MRSMAEARSIAGIAGIAILAAAAWGCNGSDPGTGDGGGTPVTCGNGRCDSGEHCGNCGDCACPSGKMCSGNACVTDTTPRCGDGACAGPTPTSGDPEDCASCPADCGCTSGQACLRETHVCGNPLIDAIPGRWNNVARTPTFTDTAKDATRLLGPDCGCAEQPAGDACFIGLNPPNSFVLSGTRVFLAGCSDTLEGQVLEGGTRIVYNWSDTDGDSGHEEWEKVE